MRIQVIEVPPQTAKDVFAWFQQDIKFTGTFLMDPTDIPLHIPLRIASADNRDFCL